jgi:hypothetical protein
MQLCLGGGVGQRHQHRLLSSADAQLALKSPDDKPGTEIETNLKSEDL